MKRKLIITKNIEKGIKQFKDADKEQQKPNFILERNIIDDEYEHLEGLERINCLANSSSCIVKNNDGKIVEKNFKHDTGNTALTIDVKNDQVFLNIISDSDDDIYINIPSKDLDIDNMNMTIEEHSGNRHTYKGFEYKQSLFGYNAAEQSNDLEDIPIVIVDDKKSEVIGMSNLSEELKLSNR